MHPQVLVCKPLSRSVRKVENKLFPEPWENPFPGLCAAFFRRCLLSSRAVMRSGSSSVSLGKVLCESRQSLWGLVVPAAGQGAGSTDSPGTRRSGRVLNLQFFQLLIADSVSPVSPQRILKFIT